MYIIIFLVTKQNSQMGLDGTKSQCFLIVIVIIPTRAVTTRPTNKHAWVAAKNRPVQEWKGVLETYNLEPSKNRCLPLKR